MLWPHQSVCFKVVLKSCDCFRKLASCAQNLKIQACVQNFISIRINGQDNKNKTKIIKRNSENIHTAEL